MKPLGEFELWFVTGSQEMYGESVLRRVDDDARQVASALVAASSSIGVAAWMHMFSPAKMWNPGLVALRKPLLHLRTQFNREPPLAELDMDFMLRAASAWCAHTSAP